jgi:hypothetical protein
MVTGHEYPDLDTRPKVSSALAIHEQLVIHGVRYRHSLEGWQPGGIAQCDDLVRIFNSRATKLQ